MSVKNTQQKSTVKRRRRGFERTSGLLQSQIRKVGESRGFAVSRLLTHWQEIVGDETAQMALPVNISYSKGGFGATLTILTTGSNAPMLQAELPKIQEKVNQCYGYTAISRIRITQTAPIGFAEGQVAFSPKKPDNAKPIDPRITVVAKEVASAVCDNPLRQALETLGQNVLTKNKT